MVRLLKTSLIVETLMKPFVPLNLASAMAPWLTGAALLATGALAQAQSFCASDGQPRPVQLMERFINADCSSCWADPATPQAGAGQMALDWVVPGRAGEDAPLSAVASRDAQERLQALGRPEPTQASSQTQPVRRLRGPRCALHTDCRSMTTSGHR